MAYNKINFVNDETEASAENFDHMEDGILNSYNVSLLAVSETAPSECSTGDKYYNTTTKKIYTATGTNTWGSTGEDPISDILYVVFSEKNTYSYDGTDLVSVGGGSGSEIVVEPDEPTEDTKLIFESIDLDAQYTESEYYSTEEVKTNKVWIDGKPIYRKVYNTFTTSSDQTYTYIVIDTFLNINILPTSSYTIQAGNFNLSGATPDVGLGKFGSISQNNSGLIFIATTTTNRELSDFECILEYTKGGNS